MHIDLIGICWSLLVEQTAKGSMMEQGILTQRIRRAQAAMQERDVDFLCVAPSSDLVYFLDLAVNVDEGGPLPLLIIPQHGTAHLAITDLERAQVAGKEGLVQIHSLDGYQQFTGLVRAIVNEMVSPVIGVSDQMSTGFLVSMLESMPDADFVSDASVIGDLRILKDVGEIDRLKRAAALADASWEEFIGAARLTGKTEQQAIAELAMLQTAHGLELTSSCICTSGPNSAALYPHTTTRIIQSGDSVVFGFGGRYGHYVANVTRTVHIGDPSDEYRRAYDAVLQANEAMVPLYQPEIRCQDIDAAARQVIENAGYGSYVSRQFGHGLGLDGHEEPYLIKGNTLPLAAGMVVTDGPGIYVPGSFGIRIEDALIVCVGGGEKINHCCRELVVMD